MIVQALIAIILLKEINGQVVPVVTSEGGKAKFEFDEKIDEKDFTCLKKDVELKFTDRYGLTEPDGITIFEISGVKREDFGSYTCKKKDNTKTVDYSLIVIGPIKLEVKQNKNTVELTCEASIAKDKAFTPKDDILLQILINEEEDKKTSMLDNENEVSYKTLNYKGDLDVKIPKQTVECKVKTKSFEPSEKKEIVIKEGGIPKSRSGSLSGPLYLVALLSLTITKIVIF